jgi:P-type Ca2+ transporter type 2C
MAQESADPASHDAGQEKRLPGTLASRRKAGSGLMDGLTSEQALALLAHHGPNALPERLPDPVWRRFVRQFQNPLIYLLLFALGFDVLVWQLETRGGAGGWPIEATAIGLILFLNAALGVYQERRSEAALARLKALSAARAWVLRDGRFSRIAADMLVPGDWVRLDAGDRVPADGTLKQARATLFDESILTGESLPTEKADGDEVWSGSLLVRGQGLIEITRTGPSSAMGRLAASLGEVRPTPTPLERRVDQLGRQIARWVLWASVALTLAGVAAEGIARAPHVVVFVVALAVAAVPEGLPAVLTVALALGVERMARRRAVVRRLSAVEALGSVTVIATDKTGTLTENRMDVRALDAVDLPRALVAGALANDADITTGAGDPLDLGLLRYVAAHGVDVAATRSAHRRVGEQPFDSTSKFMRVTVVDDERLTSFWKGAPEVVLAQCALTAADRLSWSEKATAYAREGYRVLALAESDGRGAPPSGHSEALTLLGLALFWDPPRTEVRQAVGGALAAGIHVVMITGDHPATALAVADQIGLPSSRVLTGEDLSDLPDRTLADALAEVNVFARVRPEQKLRVVEALQARHEIVAMTGDGVNDAPALKRADVGVAMGQRGSDVSREVADLVLLDDNFATIVGAVEEGRSIYENVQKFLRFLFSTNLSEVLLVALGAVLAFALDLRDEAGALLLPLSAAQILWINLATDGLPALALAFDRTPGVMQHPPRPAASPLLDAPSLRFVLSVGSMKALLSLAILGLVPWLGYTMPEARAATFHFMAIGQLLLTYPARRSRTAPLTNPYLHAAVGVGIVIQIVAAWVPFTSELLGGASMPPQLWGIVIAWILAAWALATALGHLVWRDTPDHATSGSS